MTTDRRKLCLAPSPGTPGEGWGEGSRDGHRSTSCANRSEPSPNLSRRTGRGANAGFAAIFAITLLLLVAVTLAVMGRYFANEATRTRAAKSDAQLRQLITAGAAVAIHRADHPATDEAVTLPPSLATEGATLTIKLTGEADNRTAIIHATLAARTIEQTLQLSRADNRWHVR